MKCDLMVGARFDIESETLLDWDKRLPCDKDAAATYHLKQVKADIHLCDEHKELFINFAGTLEDL